MPLPEPPLNAAPQSWEWYEWYRQLKDYVTTATGTIPWDTVDKTGSDIMDISNRAHNDLQSFNGGTSGEYYHLTSAQHSALTTADTGWTDQTATGSKADLGGSPTTAALASFCRSLYDAIKAAGIISN